MIELAVTTLLWAFSFSLIGLFISKDIDPYIAVSIRFLLAFIFLLPFLKLKKLPKKIIFQVIGVGALQIGVMYIAFYQSFYFISVPEVILFTVFTPLYITLFNDILERKFSSKFFLSALLAISGAAVIKWTSLNDNFLVGFLIVQFANISFGIGQVLFRKIMLALPEELKGTVFTKDIFALFYLGALVVAIPAMLIFGNFDRLPSTNTHYIVLLWLGIGASGLGYVLWNSGACKVSVGTLAVMNNALVPLGIVISIFFGISLNNIVQFLIGSLLIVFALWINTTDFISKSTSENS